MRKYILAAFGMSAMAFSFLAKAHAEEEAVLNVYNWSDYIAEDTIEKFTEATGIKVNYDVFDSNEVLEAKLLTGNAGYDIVVPSDSFLARQIMAGVFLPLNKAALPNLANMDPKLMDKISAISDPGNKHSVIYLWGTTGIGYNEGKVKEALGDDAPVNSWDLVFKPENMEKLKDCGVTFLDAPTEMIGAALLYLGLDPNSSDEGDVEKATKLLQSVQPYIRYFHSSQYIDDIAAGEICVAVGWSGDIFQARDSAAEGVEVGYSIPDEGAGLWFDMLAIPADAPHPENAHKFINFIMDAKITGDITNYVWYANGNTASMQYVEDEIKADTSVFPTDEVFEKLWIGEVKNSAQSRIVNNGWSASKSGQ